MEMVRGLPCLDHVEQFCDVRSRGDFPFLAG
jgi:hypothetical protein